MSGRSSSRRSSRLRPRSRDRSCASTSMSPNTRRWLCSTAASCASTATTATTRAIAGRSTSSRDHSPRELRGHRGSILQRRPTVHRDTRRATREVEPSAITRRRWTTTDERQLDRRHRRLELDPMRRDAVSLAMKASSAAPRASDAWLNASCRARCLRQAPPWLQRNPRGRPLPDTRSGGPGR